MECNEEIIKRYVEGESISSLAQTTPYSYMVIRNMLVSAGVQIRGGRKKIEFTPEQIEYITNEYCYGIATLNDIAKHLEIPKTRVQSFIVNNHLTRQNPNSKNRVNKHLIYDYFSCIDTPEKAYYLGLLFTDGSVDTNRYRIRITLQSRDKDILEQMRKDLQVDSNLILDPRGKGCFSLEFCNKKMFEDLAKYNIIPNKTYSVKHLPTNIPKEFEKDFLRGLLDGDGGITYSENMSSDVTVHFTSYYESIVTEFRDRIDLLIEKEKHNQPIYTTCWHVSWRGYNQVLSILNILYKDSSRYINRKYEKYLSLLNR